MKKEEMYFVADTENTVPKDANGAKDFKTHVWGCAYGRVGGNEVHVYQTLEEMFDAIKREVGRIYSPVVYFHNLAWDGTLILDWLCRNYGYTWGSDPWRCKKHEYRTMISDKGMWYRVQFNWKGVTIVLRDSLKILPFSVDKLAKGFGTKHKKLKGEIDYTIERPEGWKITDSERRYIENDVFVVMEALEMVREYGLLDSLTIGSCCLKNYKQIMGAAYDEFFPCLSPELDAEIRKSYRGGWCYVNPKFENKILLGVDGYTYDVNSLYPYAMDSNVWTGDVEHIFPVGQLRGTFTDDDFEQYKNTCYFVKIECAFKIKKDHLPFIQIKNSRFRDNEYLTDSDGMVELTLTRPDYELLHEQYDVYYEYVEKGWYFGCAKGIYDKYIQHWYKVKEEATKSGNKVLRQLAKLFLNNLYGKMATSLNADSKIPYWDEEKEKLAWEVLLDTKDGVYIPAGAYITAYARGKTVRAAQKNYDIFCYADTDSIHCIGQATGLDIDPIALGAWDNEARWNKARFVRQKTYVEHQTYDGGKRLDDPVWNVKACGAPNTVKLRIQYEVGLDEELELDEDGNVMPEFNKYSDEEFLDRFTFGLVESGKLSRKQTQGGVILYNTTFNIHR